MVLTQFTLALCLSLTSAIVSVVIGAVGRRNFSNATIFSAIIFCAVVPVAMHFIYLFLEVYVTILDWPIDAGSFLSLWTPLAAILIASWLGGFLGVISGKYWGEGDRSCVQCLLGPIVILFMISIVILALP
ncbi:MAG: hypothetical protein E3J86_05750 [Candidatus Thorarchaeota archaeon]|nr:MAG: hypothetical protein E3J86_05750 [Candidatus Thorarchaeota archaeon]